MNSTTLILITAIFASPFIGVLVTSFFSKKKTGAETHNLNISGEINLGEAWQKYGIQMQQDLASLSIKFDALSKEFEVIKKDRDRIADENIEKDLLNKRMYTQNQILLQESTDYKKRVETLEIQVKSLQEEVEKYKGQASPEHMAEMAHQAIDSIKDQAIIDNEKQNA